MTTVGRKADVDYQDSVLLLWIMLPNASYGSWSEATLTAWDKPFSDR